MSTIGYVTVEEANSYIAGHYISTDPLRVGWQALSDDDKASVLLKSFDTLEMLPFTGRKTSCDQQTAFPRNGSDVVPDKIKYAQIENALSLSDATTQEDAAFYQKLWQYGVQEYSIGNLSERTSSGTWGSGLATGSGVVSTKAMNYLQPYLRGCYQIQGPSRRCIR